MKISLDLPEIGLWLGVGALVAGLYLFDYRWALVGGGFIVGLLAFALKGKQ